MGHDKVNKLERGEWPENNSYNNNYCTAFL